MANVAKNTDTQNIPGRYAVTPLSPPIEQWVLLLCESLETK